MSYPLSSLELALGIMLGSGGSAVIARSWGRARRRRPAGLHLHRDGDADHGAAFMAVCLLFLDPILAFLGTSEAQLPYCGPIPKFC